MATAKDWIDAARPKTLGAAVAPVLVGSALGWRLGHEWHPWLAFFTLFACMALQIATNFFNDAIDFVKGTDTAERLGPRRITASGVVTPRQVLLAACGMLAVAMALSVPLIMARGWPIIAIGIPSLYFCFGYTGGPAPLAYRGLGELFVILFFGLIAVTGSAFVQSGQWYWEAVIAGMQVGCLSTVLIAINNLRDVAEDSKSGKKTLAVRFGTTFAKWEITSLLALALLSTFHWMQFATRNGALATMPLLAAVFMSGRVLGPVWKRNPSPGLNLALANAGKVLVLWSSGVAWLLYRGA